MIIFFIKEKQLREKAEEFIRQLQNEKNSMGMSQTAAAMNIDAMRKDMERLEVREKILIFR